MEKNSSKTEFTQLEQHENEEVHHDIQSCLNKGVIKKSPIQRTMTKIFSRKAKKRSLQLLHSCPICLNEFQKPSDLIEHMLTHTGEKPYTCKFCENIYICETDLKSHIKMHYGHSCNRCGETFSAIVNLAKHLKSQCQGTKKTRRPLKQHKNIEDDFNDYSSLWHSEDDIKELAVNGIKTDIMTQEEKERHTLPLTCQICEIEFLKPSDLVEHTLTHNREKSYSCNFCENIYSYKKDLDSHVKTHFGHSCSKCGKTYCSVVGLAKHLKKDCQNRKKLPPLLDQYEKMDKSYQVDVKTEDTLIEQTQLPLRKAEKLPTQIPHFCPICSNEFCKSSDLTEHMLIHTGELPYCCKFCSNTFTCENGLNAHIKTRHGHACNKCGDAFSDVVDLAKHLKDHCEVIVYKCKECGDTFAGQAALQRHVNNHKGGKLYPCEFCDKVFPQQHKLKIHERIHTGEKPYTCIECGEKFNRKDAMRRHMMDHNGIKPFVCEICSRGFTQLCNLKTHIKIHYNEKTNECTICGKKFSRRYHLKRHYETHIGEKSYCCEICGKSFTQESGLKMHSITHSGEKPHVCQVCGKGFSRAWHLKRHLETHDKLRRDISHRPFKIKTDSTVKNIAETQSYETDEVKTDDATPISKSVTNGLLLLSHASMIVTSSMEATCCESKNLQTSIKSDKKPEQQFPLSFLSSASSNDITAANNNDVNACLHDQETTSLSPIENVKNVSPESDLSNNSPLDLSVKSESSVLKYV